MPFDFDTEAGGGGQGEPGPYVKWYSDGSAKKSIPPANFAIRTKHGEDDSAYWTEEVLEAFKTGVVLNLESTKQGWIKDGGRNVAPERRWAPACDPRVRPDESKKQSGGFAWSAAFGIRIAVGGGVDAWWEDSSFAGFDGFKMLAKQIHEQAGANPGKCPMVILTGVEKGQTKNGDFAKPILTIKAWMDPPACFKKEESAMNFDAGESKEPAAATPPVAEKKQPEAATADGEF